jgi:hypothetical protein
MAKPFLCVQVAALAMVSRGGGAVVGSNQTGCR